MSSRLQRVRRLLADPEHAEQGFELGLQVRGTQGLLRYEVARGVVRLKGAPLDYGRLRWACHTGDPRIVRLEAVAYWGTTVLDGPPWTGLECLERLPGLRELELYRCGPVDLSRLALRYVMVESEHPPRLPEGPSTVFLTGLGQARALPWLPSSTQVFGLRGGTRIVDCSSLEGLPIELLYLTGLMEQRDWSFLRTLPALRMLSLERCSLVRRGDLPEGVEVRALGAMGAVLDR